MSQTAYVVTLLTQIVDRETKETLYEENAVVLFRDYREYFDGHSYIEYSCDDEIAYYVKKQMLASLYARDSMSKDSAVKPLREKIKGRTFYVDALVVDTKEYLDYEHLKNLPRHRWMPEGTGPLLCGIINPFEEIPCK